jgi:integrase
MLREIDCLTEQEVANLIKDAFADIKAQVDRPYVVRTADPWFERQEQQHFAEEHMASLDRQRDGGAFSPEVIRLAEDFAASKGVSISGGSPERLRMIAEGFARVLIEADRCFVHRLEDSVAAYHPQDTLFAHEPRDLAEKVGLTLDELIKAYLRAHKTSWRPKTYRTHGPKLQLLAEYVGGDRLADSITRKDLSHFPDELLRLRRNHHTMPAPNFHSRQTDNPNARIMASTATGILARTTGLFAWAFVKGYIATNPAQKLTITQPKIKKGQKGRRPFTPEELKILFSAPQFTGCVSCHRRNEPGDVVVKDDEYWLPILGFYTGARLSELIQLHLSDCFLDDEYPHISINEDGQEKPGDPDYKHVKSEAGIRCIPIHPDLFELGFMEFFARQSKLAGKRKRLFSRISYGADGHPSTPYSKKFGRLLSKLGLDDPQLVFHSFRHTMMDTFRNSGTSKFVVDRIIGHQDQSAAAQYGIGVSKQVAWEVVASIKMPICLSALWTTKVQA